MRTGAAVTAGPVRRGGRRGDTKSIGRPGSTRQATSPDRGAWNHPSPCDVQVHEVPGMPSRAGVGPFECGVTVSEQDEVARFAALLREFKERTDRSYGSLARRLGMNTSTLHRYCAGDAVPVDFAPVERCAARCGGTREERLELHPRWLLAAEARRRPRTDGVAREAPPGTEPATGTPGASRASGRAARGPAGPAAGPPAGPGPAGAPPPAPRAAPPAPPPRRGRNHGAPRTPP